MGQCVQTPTALRDAADKGEYLLLVAEEALQVCQAVGFDISESLQAIAFLQEKKLPDSFVVRRPCGSRLLASEPTDFF